MEDSAASGASSGGELIVEPDSSIESKECNADLESSLTKVAEEILTICQQSSEESTREWRHASEVVRDFKPVPWFVWRLTNFVFSPAMPRDLPEGFVLGLRRLLFATASDELFGTGQKVNSLRESLRILSPELVGSISAIHAICRRLAGKDLQRIWHPLLDEALLGARIGYLVGRNQPDFGAGRGMLAGFVDSIGLAILVALGEEDRATAYFEELSRGGSAAVAGRDLYGCHPLHVGAMLLTAIGCGGNACFGIVASLSSSPLEIVSNFEQRQWLAALTIIHAVRNGTINEVEDDHWQVLNLESAEQQQILVKTAKAYIRKSHGLHWIE